MNYPTFDADGYPTEETLQAIRKWPVEDHHNLFTFVREAWHYKDYWDTKGNTHYASTGGWSGNESLIEALQANTAVWILCWQSSSRGGHYVLREGTKEL